MLLRLPGASWKPPSRPRHSFPAMCSGNTTEALFSDDGTEPIAQYSTPIADVNPADAALLKEGIRLRGLTEVSRLLEDLDIE